jgi:hypothetical protein
MTSPYLDRPLLPLAVALPRLLQEVEAALPIAGPAETRRLHKRADLIRGLLAPRVTNIGLEASPSALTEAGTLFDPGAG